MSILSTYFDKIYCLNLKRRPDRMEKIQLIFDNLGFDDVERYECVDYRDMILPKIEDRSPLAVGNYGITQTNINIITEAKEKGYKTLLTIEDDVFFSDEVHKLKEYLDAVPNDWDMIYFGGNHMYGTPPIKVNDKIIKLNKTISTHCVAFKDTIYDKLLEITKDRFKSVDNYYSDLHPTINAYGFSPSMAFQTVGYSDIQEQIVDYNIFF